MPELEEPEFSNVNNFFGISFTKKTDLRKYMMEKLTKEDINAEIASVGGEEQSTKTKAIAEILKEYRPMPRTKKIGKGLSSNCIYVNQAKYSL